jgi:histidyl-tRNA synthetase
LEFAYAFLKEISLDGHPIMINSIGRSECRLKYSEVILNHLESFLKDVEDGVRLRIQKNPLGVLDTKDEVLQRAIEGVPSILNFLEDESKQRFDTLQELLVEAGIPFVVSPEIVRGLDYYTETVFEFVHPLLPGISAFAGGRYDNLIKQLGGSPTPSVGFGMGMERLILALEANGRTSSLSSPQVFVVCASQSARSECRKLIRDLRSEGIISCYDLDNRSLKSQMRQADSSGAEFALIIGEDEIANKTVTVRNLKSGSQELVLRTKVVDNLVNPNGSSWEDNGL